jgi:hypothetical protein
MTIDPTLFNAILSMDAYNRGYNEGIALDTVEGVTYLGDALIVSQSDIDENSSGVNIGFYALAYSYNGETIISFRGTDTFVLDPIHGWPLGDGNTTASRAGWPLSFIRRLPGAGTG